ncbi:hypothetical protein SF12_06430 [Streptomyces sp. MBRL 601]|uniref:hypothetical protein n=1 Tax=Streptomyces koyangensis TaxID=188770 RepID=UPI0005E5CB81|nr:hypothetical protein SF12_06430 [Streptomyces sp. MBRL 601]
MGLDYGYDIYLRPRHVARALTSLAALAPDDRAVPPLKVTLPGGDQVVLPFTSDFKSDPVDYSTSDTFEFDTVLMFDVDETLREFSRTDGPDLEGDGRIRIGYIYVTVRYQTFLHPGYVSIECWAATSGMSRLFARSANVRKVFTDLTAASGGVCCLFDTGDGAPERVCWLNGEAVDERIGGSRYPDRAALVATWDRPEE